MGKMGIQICEKLREGLGWRQIGSCHKWDSGAGLLCHQGTAATRIQLTVCQSKSPDASLVCCWGRLETSDKLLALSFCFFLLSLPFNDSKPAPLFILTSSLARESHFIQHSDCRRSPPSFCSLEQMRDWSGEKTVPPVQLMHFFSRKHFSLHVFHSACAKVSLARSTALHRCSYGGPGPLKGFGIFPLTTQLA